MVKKNNLYSEHDVVQYALNYTIDYMHGCDESFDLWIERVEDLRNLKPKYGTDYIFSYEYLKFICINYCDYSKSKNWDVIFDVWYKPFTINNKINKIKNRYKK